MGLFSWLFGQKQERYVTLEGDGDYDLQIVGESFYQDALDRICGGKTEDGHEFYCEAVLVREPSNPHDKNAIAVYINDLKVGHINRAQAKPLTRIFRDQGLAGGIAKAVIVGGWAGRRNQSDGHYGVRLDIPVS